MSHVGSVVRKCLLNNPLIFSLLLEGHKWPRKRLTCSKSRDSSLRTPWAIVSVWSTGCLDMALEHGCPDVRRSRALTSNSPHSFLYIVVGEYLWEGSSTPFKSEAGGCLRRVRDQPVYVACWDILCEACKIPGHTSLVDRMARTKSV